MADIEIARRGGAIHGLFLQRGRSGRSLVNWSGQRWRLGELLGRDEGRALVDQVRAAQVAEGIVRPDRVVAMFVPVATDARRS